MKRSEVVLPFYMEGVATFFKILFRLGGELRLGGIFPLSHPPVYNTLIACTNLLCAILYSIYYWKWNSHLF